MSSNGTDDMKSLERMVAGWMTDEAAGSGPDALLEDILAITGRKRPARRWIALLEEPPMRTHARLAVGIPARGYAMVGIALLLIAGLVGLAVIGRTPSIVTPVPTVVAPAPAIVTSPRPSTSPTTPALLSDGLIVVEYWRPPGLGVRLEPWLPGRPRVELLPGVKGVQELPAWNPPGTHLAYSGYDTTNAAPHEYIWETDATGANPRLISTDCAPPACLHELDGAYSPDGTQMVMVRVSGPKVGSETSSVIAIRNLRTGAVRELETTRQTMPGVPDAIGQLSNDKLQHPRWSPDGSRITFTLVHWYGRTGAPTDDWVKDSSIYIVAADGGGLKRLSPVNLTAGDAEWSPDGSLILFSSEPFQVSWRRFGQGDLGKMHIYTMSPDGGNVGRVDDLPWSTTPTWTAGGAQILFSVIVDNRGTGNTHIHVMDRDGSNDRLVVKFSDCCRSYLVQQPTP